MTDPLRNMAEAIDFLYNALPVFHRQGPAAYKADIGNISRLLAFDDNPHLCGTKFIHIAGTNGKGSVAHLIAAYLTSNGYSCGLYSSPHYADIRERIKKDGQLISETDFVRILNHYLPIINEVQPSFFEIICAMAFSWFRDQQLEYAVIEVGMGGRLDSTNIITPVLSVITNISMDHTAFLGNTLAAIAGEKAGIVKNHVPVVIGEFDKETAPVFIVKAESQNAPIYFAEELAACTVIEEGRYDGRYKLQINDLLGKTEVSTSLRGKYQSLNITTAAAVVWCLDKMSLIRFDREKYLRSVTDCTSLTYLIGRWQLMEHSPDLILEGAHNIAGIREITEQLRAENYRIKHIIFGTVSDKDVSPVLALLPQDAIYYWTKADIPRAMGPAILKEKAVEFGLNGNIYSSVKEALNAARKHANEDDLILVTGSIFVAGDAMNLLDKQQ